MFFSPFLISAAGVAVCFFCPVAAAAAAAAALVVSALAVGAARFSREASSHGALETLPVVISPTPYAAYSAESYVRCACF